MPTRVTLTWERLVGQLSHHDFLDPAPQDCPSCSGSGCSVCKDTGEVPAKLTCPAFSAGCYPEHTPRGNDGVESLSIFVADLDNLSDDDLVKFGEYVQSNGWACHMFSTWSAGTKPGIRARAVLPLSRPVMPAEWSHVWQALNQKLGSFSDPKCKDAARLYFGAYAPAGKEEHTWTHTTEGQPVDVSALLDGWAPPPPPAPRPQDTSEPREPSQDLERVTRERLQRFGRFLSRKRDDRRSETGAMILRVVAGESFADAGSRDNTIYRIAQELGERFHDCDPVSIAAHFGPSLQLMAREAPDCQTVDDVAYKIERRQHEVNSAQAQAEAEEMTAQRQRIRDAFRSDRDTPYTPEELPARPRWILQKGGAYFTWVLDTYRGPYTKEEAHNAILRDLSPAVSAGVELFQMTPSGDTVPKSLGKLVRDYGLVIDQVSVDLSAERSYFAEETRTVVEAPCPLRDITPRRHEPIHEWLLALGGPRSHLLLAWIANVTRLNMPCTALFLTGAPHTGKSLLPEGLSKLWSRAGMPVHLEDVLGTAFNDAQLRSPLVFADERLPTDHRGKVLDAELRHFIQARTRPLRRKYLPNAEMVGSIRLVISANNEEVLATTGSLTNHDIDAIIERYLWISAQPEARDVLRRYDVTDWAGADMIAEHALWLRDNFEWSSNGRFLVHSDDKELHSRLVSGSGIRSSVLQFCVGYLMNPKRVDSDPQGRMFIRVHQNKLCVNTKALVTCWDHYVTNERCPPTGRIASAIGALATQERLRLRLPNGKRPNYRVIKTDHLVAWAKRTGYADEEQILEALAKDTQEFKLKAVVGQ